jgi:hypothetical protein
MKFVNSHTTIAETLQDFWQNSGIIFFRAMNDRVPIGIQIYDLHNAIFGKSKISSSCCRCFFGYLTTISRKVIPAH